MFYHKLQFLGTTGRTFFICTELHELCFDFYICTSVDFSDTVHVSIFDFAYDMYLDMYCILILLAIDFEYAFQFKL